MQRSLCVLSLLLWVSLSIISEDEQSWKHLQFILNKDSTVDKEGYGRHCSESSASSGILDVADRLWSNIIYNKPVLVNKFCFDLESLGNSIGTYLNELTCADILHFHFVSIYRDFSRIHSNRSLGFHFLETLPRLVIHQNPTDGITSLKPYQIIEKCNCNIFCWENVNASWIQRLPLLKAVLRQAFSSLLRHDATFEWPVPDVAIHYRCSDNLARDWYGLLPFSVFRTVIPTLTTTSIYILSDPPDRKQTHKLAQHCPKILTRLKKYLSRLFPSASITLHRGGNPFHAMTYLAYANTTVCSASTFCFYPGLANIGGTVYFPKTKLISQGQMPDLGKNFKWIKRPEILSDQSIGLLNTSDIIRMLLRSSLP